MFQSTSTEVALLSTIDLVLYQIELRDNILEYQIVIVVPDVTKMWIQNWGSICMWHCKSYLQMGSLVSISLRVLVTSLSIPAGVIYIVPLFGSVLMLSHGCSSEVTLLESNYASSCASHRLSPQVRQIHQTSSDFTCSITRSYSMSYWYPVGTADNNDNS